MNLFSVLKKRWGNRSTLGNSNQTQELAAFLPAVLEIQETPPNPLIRWLAWTLLALVTFSIVWASLGHVNIVSSAEGKTIPSSRVKVIQPLEKGVVEEIKVKEGQHVHKGQPLIVLDHTLTQVHLQRAVLELKNSEEQLATHQAMLSLLQQAKHQEAEIHPRSHKLILPDTSQFHNTPLNKNLLKQKWLEYQAQLHTLDSNWQQIRAQQAASRETIARLESTLPIATKKAEAEKELYDKGFGSELDYLTPEEERLRQFHELRVQRQRLKELIAAELGTNDQIYLYKAQTTANLITETTELKRQVAILREEFIKAREDDIKKTLYAPVNGHVQNLIVTTVGGIVTAAQQLMLIVPEGERLEAEVFLENKDIGFIHQGMDAEIKVHTFPFTKYGVIDASIINVSDDAIVDEQRGLIYRMQLRMNKNSIQVDGKDIPLQPGMAVTAEVKTGQRRIIEFFLAPLLRAKNESIRER
ncbi:MAG: HlyD family type I secretion periplasmic adaptor subunit [Gammaproteobacteria bacterium]